MLESSSSGLQRRTSEMEVLAQRGYIIGNKVGQGSFATVHVVDYQDPNTEKHQRLACKIFDKKRTPPYYVDTFFARELEILTKLENPHVIKLHSIHERGPRVFIFMSYAENGTLQEFIIENGVVLESKARVWLRQMATGLQYLHSNQIAHRDLKCDNILLSKGDNAKLADFGLARYCVDRDGHRVLSETYCGSSNYIAPEVLTRTPYNPKLADIWSLGVILYIMLNGSMPFDGSNLNNLLKEQLGKKWSFDKNFQRVFSEDAKTILNKMLEPDIAIRLNSDMVLACNWLDQKSQSNVTIPSSVTFVHESNVRKSKSAPG